MASSANLDNVLKQLTAIFRRLNSGEDALSELQVLKEHCGRVLAEERKRVSNSANTEEVGQLSREFLDQSNRANFYASWLRFLSRKFTQDGKNL